MWWKGVSAGAWRKEAERFAAGGDESERAERVVPGGEGAGFAEGREDAERVTAGGEGAEE